MEEREREREETFIVAISNGTLFFFWCGVSGLSCMHVRTRVGKWSNITQSDRKKVKQSKKTTRNTHLENEGFCCEKKWTKFKAVGLKIKRKKRGKKKENKGKQEKENE